MTTRKILTDAEALERMLKNAGLSEVAAKTFINMVSEEEETPFKVDVQILRLLNSLGIPAHLIGYTYLKSAIAMTFKHPELIHSVTKKLYPMLAVKHNATPSRVERAIRTAIARIEPNNDNDLKSLGFFLSERHITNAEFIAIVSEMFIALSSKEAICESRN